MEKGENIPSQMRLKYEGLIAWKGEMEMGKNKGAMIRQVLEKQLHSQRRGPKSALFEWLDVMMCFKNLLGPGHRVKMIL